MTFENQFFLPNGEKIYMYEIKENHKEDNIQWQFNIILVIYFFSLTFVFPLYLHVTIKKIEIEPKDFGKPDVI